MKKTVLAITLAALTLPALAQDKKAPEPEFTISGNFGLFSDYRFRGVSQTDKKPAAQGGFDLAHKSGLYVGTWTSNVSQWTAAGASQEVDLYGGFKGSLAGGVGFDIGAIAYQYPGNTATVKNNTREIYVGLSYGPASYKLSRTTGNWFGVNDSSKGSLYHDITVSYPLMDKLTLSAHVGYQKIKNGDEDFKDYKIGVAYDLGDSYSLGLAVTKVSFKDDAAGEAWFTNASGKKLYDNGTVLSLTKTF